MMLGCGKPPPKDLTCLISLAGHGVSRVYTLFSLERLHALSIAEAGPSHGPPTWDTEEGGRWAEPRTQWCPVGTLCLHII